MLDQHDIPKTNDEAERRHLNQMLTNLIEPNSDRSHSKSQSLIAKAEGFSKEMAWSGMLAAQA